MRILPTQTASTKNWRNYFRPEASPTPAMARAAPVCYGRAMHRTEPARPAEAPL